jgi:hypothetical protein
MSVGEMLGGAAQDSNGAQLKFKQINDTSPPFLLRQEELITEYIVLNDFNVCQIGYRVL